MTQVISTAENMKDTPKNALNDNDANAQRQRDSIPDPMALSQALMNAYQKSQPLFMEMAEKYGAAMSQNPPEPLNPDPMNVMPDAIELMTAMVSNPMKYGAMQLQLAQNQMDLWKASCEKFAGKDVTPIIEPEKGDRRFKDEAWSDSALFDFIKQYYLLASNFTKTLIDTTEGLTEQQKDKLQFIAKMFLDALSPSNFLITNPVVLNETIKTGGQNLIQGMQNLSQDLQRGKGELNISMTDTKAFKLGENIATTQGDVVFENDLLQLIQYKPTTEEVAKRPMLVIPPWINKYYILDLRPENSFVKWATDQGNTVFCISWVNPDASMGHKNFEDYVTGGLLEAMDAIKDITGEPDLNAVGYCLGGTLLTTTMAYLAEIKQDKRIASATFLTTLIDFEKSGDMKLFMGQNMSGELDSLLNKYNVFPASKMKQTFSLLRANDMIWSFAVNNYLMGKEPFPFDLLYWNDDATNLPAAMHRFYLKNMYQDNVLKNPGGITIDGVKIDVRKIKTPCYFLSTREDHIAPWEGTYAGTQLFASKDITFTLAASGHIAGVVNAPQNNKYCYWTSDDTPGLPEDWMEGAKEQAGSWWPHWNKWLINHNDGQKTTARSVKNSLEPAPGRYVRMSAD